MRRGVRNVLGAGAAVVCLGGLLAACGGESGDGYVATGAAGASPERAPGKAVGPTGDVRLVPLDGAKGSGGDGEDGRGGSAKAPSGSAEGGDSGDGGDSEGKSPGAEGSSGGAAAQEGGAASDGGANPGRTEGSSPGSGSAGGSGGSGGSGSPSAPGKDEPSGGASPTGPARLAVGEPKREPADKRWCEKVTLTFHNTGGSPVRSGEVTFGTHIIGALGVDWDTIESTVSLPAPIGAGERVKKTWPVCVDAWRVPLGMHVETRDVDVDWK
ncbi:hypothetical protein [Streptomyces silaceus]|uniref:hypothetical protein n=1 Tax=Streptomyces silaceus TaxID=545123 RepID=UPI0006EBC4E7|nr:hypothetical protein [Streptomyces silaceus]